MNPVLFLSKRGLTHLFLEISQHLHVRTCIVLYEYCESWGLKDLHVLTKNNANRRNLVIAHRSLSFFLQQRAILTSLLNEKNTKTKTNVKKQKKKLLPFVRHWNSNTIIDHVTQHSFICHPNPLSEQGLHTYKNNYYIMYGLLASFFVSWFTEHGLTDF